MDDAIQQPPKSGPARQPRQSGVVIAALTAPLLAAFLGTFLVFALISVLMADPAPSLSEIGGLVLGSLIVALAGLVIAAPLTYLLGGPVMALAWWLAHRQGWRGPGAMALVMACAGALFGVIVYGLIWREPHMVLAGAAGGFLTGLPCGAYISAIAYRKSAD